MADPVRTLTRDELNRRLDEAAANSMRRDDAPEQRVVAREGDRVSIDVFPKRSPAAED